MRVINDYDDEEKRQLIREFQNLYQETSWGGLPREIEVLIFKSLNSREVETSDVFSKETVAWENFLKQKPKGFYLDGQVTRKFLLLVGRDAFTLLIGPPLERGDYKHKELVDPRRYHTVQRVIGGGTFSFNPSLNHASFSDLSFQFGWFDPVLAHPYLLCTIRARLKIKEIEVQRKFKEDSSEGEREDVMVASRQREYFVIPNKGIWQYTFDLNKDGDCVDHGQTGSFLDEW